MIVTQRYKGANKTSEGLPVSLIETILGTQNNMDDRDIMDRTVDLKKTIMHQHQIPDQK